MLLNMKDYSSSSSHKMKPADESATTTINLTVVGPDGGRKEFRMNRSWALKELMSAYCFFWNQRLTDFVFLFKGRLLRPDHTPLQWEMEDGDEIVAQKRWT